MSKNGSFNCRRTGILIVADQEEISTRVDAKIQPTVPKIVNELLHNCKPSSKTPGLSVKTLDNESEVAAFGYAIDYDKRDCPFVLISPTSEGKYLVKADRLRYLLVGLAEVIQIPQGADTFLIEETLGSRFAAWRGAVNIIFPPVRSYSRTVIPTIRLLPDEIEEIYDSGGAPETEILSTITHKTNLPTSWRHISPSVVSDVNKKREQIKLQKDATETGESKEYVAFLEEYNREKDQEILGLKQSIDSFQDELLIIEGFKDQAEDENRKLIYENEQIKATLGGVKAIDRNASDDQIQALYDIILNVSSRYFTAKESLFVIEKLFAQKVIVLDSAKKSSDKSETFKEKKKLFDLLWKLSTDYWTALNSGKGDADARNIFRSAYACPCGNPV